MVAVVGSGSLILSGDFSENIVNVLKIVKKV